MTLLRKPFVYTSLLIAGWFSSSHAMAAQSNPLQNQLEAEITATSNYVWRGVALSTDAALQGKVSVLDPSGIHADFFTSNVAGGTELDITAGYNGRAEMFKYDIGGKLYYLPQYESSNFFEIFAGITMSGFGAKVSLSPDSGTYLEAYAVLPALEYWDLALHVGHYSIDDDDRGVTIPIEDYIDFSAAVSRVYDGMRIEFKITGTNLDDNEAMLPTDNFRTLVSVSKKFTP